MVRLPRNQKQTYWLNSKALNVTIGFDLGHDLDLEFSRSNMEFPISQPKVVRLPRNEKQTYRLNSRPQMWAMGLNLTITVTFEFWRSNLTFDLTWPWPWIFMVKFWNSCISEWEGRLTLHKGGGSRSFMTMIMTIWWPSSGVWIYQIVTGVTSVVGVPSTHLVCEDSLVFIYIILYQLYNRAKPEWLPPTTNHGCDYLSTPLSQLFLVSKMRAVVYHVLRHVLTLHMSFPVAMTKTKA